MYISGEELIPSVTIYTNLKTSVWDIPKTIIRSYGEAPAKYCRAHANLTFVVILPLGIGGILVKTIMYSCFANKCVLHFLMQDDKL